MADREKIMRGLGCCIQEPDTLSECERLECPYRYAAGFCLNALYGYTLALLKGSAWISVNDRLPETDDRVLCCTINARGMCNIVLGYYMAGRWRCGMNSNVTHWMPLPEPPMEG